MRLILILFLLGIIFYSSLISFFSDVLLEKDRVLLHVVGGSVEAGKFSLVNIGYFGPLIIELISLTGDADFYVGEYIPGYGFDQNSFSSESCGLDVIKVPNKYPRPFGITVFGYWAHAVSEYQIKIYLDIHEMAVTGNTNIYHTPGYDEDAAFHKRYSGEEIVVRTPKEQFVDSIRHLKEKFDWF